MQKKREIDELYHEIERPPKKALPKKKWKFKKWHQVAGGIAALITIGGSVAAGWQWLARGAPETSGNQSYQENANKGLGDNPLPRLSNANANSLTTTPLSNNANRAVTDTPKKKPGGKPYTPEIESTPPRIVPRESPESIWERAMSLYKRNEFAAAIRECDRGLRMYPGYKALEELMQISEEMSKVKK